LSGGVTRRFRLHDKSSSYSCFHIIVFERKLMQVFYAEYSIKKKNQMQHCNQNILLSVVPDDSLATKLTVVLLRHFKL